MKRLAAAWRRLKALFRRRTPQPQEPPTFLQVDHARLWRGPPGVGRAPSWIDRPERDRLRRDLRTYPEDYA